ncbi:MAG TPA: hypothetical protein PK385_06525 [Spirochaetota bacterium]|nr:MAG: hypothetical protein BWX91_01682 [Spirochaetes bacterium ADurb.Bin133]HNZ26203.1 hypothetical protein [Spirochaetota bacterium]HOF01572.1 hypothetical protein [Spirochaetota bacterium]HOS33699.1 hypothetical protein [Spirochaetota bacterium]HOS55697.1 hypothetical protein [Spirochaetota bacterium]
MKKIIASLFIIIFTLYSCKTIYVKDKETTANILLKNLLRESEKIGDVTVSGMIRINGVPEIPSTAYISFTFAGNLKDEKGTFGIYLLKKPVMEIIFDKKEVLIVNRKSLQYKKINVDETDYSKLIGVNFNPIEACYFLLGKIPYSENMTLINYDWNSKEHIMDLSTSVSTYKIKLNYDELIVWSEINNQFFEKIFLDSIKYVKNDDNAYVPKQATFKTDDEKRTLYFIIDKTSLNTKYTTDVNSIDLTGYSEVKSLEDFDMKAK